MRIYKAIATFVLCLVLTGKVWAADPLAGRIRTDTTNFDTNLSAADTDVQKALETLDELVAGAGSGDVTDVGDCTGGAC